MQLLRHGTTLLLDLPLRLSDLQRLHGREPVGIHLQRHELAVPRLRGLEAVLDRGLRRTPGDLHIWVRP
jgi:hypothetical protein